MSAPRYIYHERQLASMCGQHALNNLLQGPYFAIDDLMEIASELDAQERALMLSHGTETADAIRYVAEGSSNVDEGGNFSEGVLSKALERHGVSLCRRRVDIDHVIAHPEEHEAFLCNLESHWVAIRKMGGEFFNLNSLLKKPNVETVFHMSAFLAQLKAENWAIFSIEGELPAPMGTPHAGGDPRHWHPHATLTRRRTAAEEAAADDIDDEVARALQLSEAEDPDLARAVAASLDAEADDSGSVEAVGDDDAPVIVSDEEEEDEDLKRALQMSLEQN